MTDLECGGNSLYEEAREWFDEIAKRRGDVTEVEREFLSMTIAFVLFGWIERFTTDGVMQFDMLKRYVELEKERAIQLITVTFDLLVGVINGVKPEEKIKKEMETRLKALAFNRKTNEDL